MKSLAYKDGNRLVEKSFNKSYQIVDTWDVSDNIKINLKETDLLA